MQDIKLVFDGDGKTKIDFTSKVDGKYLYMQKASVNIATEANSDPLYSTRGTNLLKKAISGTFLDALAATHAGNFAALDTLNFINWQEYSSTQGSPDLIRDINIDLNSFSLSESLCTYTCYFLFADGTGNSSTSSVNYI